jgi:PIN domain nuclease of toxin-antitoxin system
VNLVLDSHTLLWLMEANPKPFPDKQHRDPFDRMLVIHALRDGLAIVGVDAAFDPYGVTRLW